MTTRIVAKGEVISPATSHASITRNNATRSDSMPPRINVLRHKNAWGAPVERLARQLFQSFFLFLSLQPQLSKAVQPCSGLLLEQVKQSPGIAVSGVEKDGVPLLEAIPDYDVEQDILYYFFQSGHAGMYLGGWFADRKSQKFFIRKNAKAVKLGVAVRVQVGHEKLRDIQAFAKSYVDTPAATCSCQHDHLYFFHQAGVYLNAPIPLFGLTVYERVLKYGFKNAQGDPYPHFVHVIGPSEMTLLKLNENLKRLQTVRTLRYLKHFGIKYADLKKLADRTPAYRGFANILEKVADKERHKEITEHEVERVTQYYQLVEEITATELERHFGDLSLAFNERLGELRKFDNTTKKQFFLGILKRAAQQFVDTEI